MLTGTTTTDGAVSAIATLVCWTGGCGETSITIAVMVGGRLVAVGAWVKVAWGVKVIDGVSVIVGIAVGTYVGRAVGGCARVGLGSAALMAATFNASGGNELTSLTGGVGGNTVGSITEGPLIVP